MTEPTSPHPLRALLGRALEFALARALALDPDTRDALRLLEGRTLSFALAAPPLALRLTVRDGGLAVGPDRGPEADLGVRGTLGGLLAQLLPRDAAAPPVGQLRINGDAELARRVQQLLSRYEPDVEEAFARVLGDVAGVQLARALKRALDGAKQGASALLRDGAEYLSEESRDVVAKGELDAFLDEVDELRDAVERLERKVARVRGRVVDGGGKGT